MKKPTFTSCFYQHLLHCIACSMVCASVAVSVNGYASTGTTQQTIERLRKLSEVKQEEATKQLEALLSTLPANSPYTDRRDILEILTNLYFRNRDEKRAGALIEQLNQIGKDHHDLRSTALALNYQAKIFEQKNNYIDSLDLTEQALALAVKSQDNLLINQLENTAADLYASIGNFQVAIQHQEHAQSVLDAIKVASWQSEVAYAKTYYWEAYLYYSINDQQTALNYLGKASNIAENLDIPILLGQILNSRGTSFAHLKQWNLAKADFSSGIKIARDTGNASAEAIGLANLADASLNMGDYDACIGNAQQAIQIAQRINDTYSDALAKGNLGICHIHAGNLVDGKKEVDASIDFMKKANELSVIEITLDELSAIYAKIGMYKEAWNTLQEKFPVTEKMEQDKRENAAVEMKLLYELVQRKKDKEQKEFILKSQNVESENETLQIYVIFLASFLAIAVGGIVFQIYRRYHFKRQHAEIARRNLQYQSSRDPLTGLLNRRAFQGVIESRKQLVDRRSADQLSLYDVVVLLDLDQFEQINELHGHDLGDAMLIELSKRLQDILREKDMLIRWGGEEFLIYLNAVPADRVTRIIERELEEIGKSSIRHQGQKIHVTVSAGYILLPLSGAAEILWDRVMELVEAALKMAKSNGGNQAYGIISTENQQADILALLNGTSNEDLDTAAKNGIISLKSIAGPS